MSPSEPLDPVVDRFRATRENLARQCGFDVTKMFEMFHSMQAAHSERVRAPRRRRIGHPVESDADSTPRS